MSDNNSTPEPSPSTNQPQPTQNPTPVPRIPVVPPEQLIGIAKSLNSNPLTKD